ncbi:phage protein GemA/Gp16 family protein, partial [uncultured Sphingopyxis sp.]|uniref:phage protein GemA/Gp16 family protein n=1 Tax=uncultured Sphingopyxis sp. TaxID=310581 RepID=UPI0025915E7D
MSAAIKMIHVAKRELGMDDDDYRAVLDRATRGAATSLRAMTDGQLQLVIGEMKKLGFVPSSPTGTSRKVKGPFAPKLLALWLSGWNLGIVHSREDQALIHFVERQTGIAHVQWLRDPRDAAKAIDGLKLWIAREAGDRRFAYDSYRRFIQMYSDVVLGLDHHEFEEILEEYKERNELTLDTQIDADAWLGIIEKFKALVEEELEKPFPQDPQEQLWGAIGAVFSSWMVPRAVTYRRLHDLPSSWGTAVNVQAMVFGNMGESSATGVAFTRDPSTGEKAYYGEWLVNAQGEDVVAGIRTPQYLT